MKNTRIISLVLALALASVALTGCLAQAYAEPESVVTVRVVDFEKNIIVEKDVSFTEEAPTPLLALQYLCIDEEIDCEFDENGIVTKIGDVEEYEDKEANILYYWSCNYNGKPARASKTVVENGGEVEFFIASMDNKPVEIEDPDAVTEE